MVLLLSNCLHNSMKLLLLNLYPFILFHRVCSATRLLSASIMRFCQLDMTITSNKLSLRTSNISSGQKYCFLSRHIVDPPSEAVLFKFYLLSVKNNSISVAIKLLKINETGQFHFNLTKLLYIGGKTFSLIDKNKK